jgi:diacylglycerol kinase (ATP)
MNVALFHNPEAGLGRLKVSKLVRQFEDADYDVRYVSMKEKHWEKAFGELIDRAVVAGGDGTVSRLVPWFSAQDIPFCILPLGTANNCARSLGQLHSVERIIDRLRNAPIKKLDLGIVTSSAGHRVFVESVGIGLLAKSMSKMHGLEKKNRSRTKLTPEERLSEALKYLISLAKKFPEGECDVLLDDEVVAGGLLLMEITNMGLIGPNLELVPAVDPADGAFDVIWVTGDERQAWKDYLKSRREGESVPPPVNCRRCRRIVVRSVDAPVHVDGKVFLTMATPVTIRPQPGALDLLDLG